MLSQLIVVTFVLLFLIQELNAITCQPGQFCCTPGVNCPVCPAPKFKPTKQRVRKNIMSLTKAEWKKVTAAVRALKAKKDGKNYDYFVAKHLGIKNDIRWDQGHFGTHFITFHSLYVLEFEVELLKIDPTIEAFPYWDWTTGVDETHPSVWTNDYFGSYPGTGSNFQVVDGEFAKFPIGEMNIAKWDSLAKYRTSNGDGSSIVFNGTTASGLLRGPTNTNKNKYVTRYRQWMYDPAGKTCKTYHGPDMLNLGSPTFCNQRGLYPFFSWWACLDLNVTPYPPFAINSLHTAPHAVVGGVKPCGSIFGEDDGDFKDTSTSPNDPVFMFHHANMDRAKMAWMANNYGGNDAFYGYPLFGSITNPFFPVWHGQSVSIGETILFPGNPYSIGLNNPVQSNFGFRDADLGIDAHPDNPDALWTHADAICWLQPWTAPYKYDTLEPDLPGQRR